MKKNKNKSWPLGPLCKVTNCYNNEDMFRRMRTWNPKKFPAKTPKGSTVTRVTTTVSSSNLDSDTTKLWHMCFGHMSEKGIAMLSKQDLLGSNKIRKVEAIKIVAYVVNKSSSAPIHDKSPDEVWSGQHVDYENLRIFSCPTCAHVNNGKLELRVNKCIFLGYSSGVKGYRLWCPDSKSPKFLISRYMTFDESSMLLKKEELITTRKDHGAREKVELEVQATDSLTKIPIDKEDSSHSTKDN
ncbi:hypothetical protein RJ639_020867 [Escallonia herrerae]|uniref:GAG-pre-integrase domain-containing protein n=1 Tax=Escallonia herrerae TaxID=1293975 RepID=A0AA89AG93_9ASTE|nr:hypothetical protein RJ639_020867 [Escallonia herrerae]